MASDLPCDGDGLCMKCKVSPPQGEVVLCTTCTTPWHIQCLSTPPETMVAALAWECPDCSPAVVPAAGGGGCGGAGDLIASIRAIEADASLTEQEKAKRRQELLSGGKTSEVEEKKEKGKGKAVEGGDDVMDLLDASFNCSFCMQLPERPVTTPCGHNFCLKCFQKWVRQGNHTCAKCRSNIPSSMASQPRINATLVVAIRMAKVAKSATSGGAPQAYHFIRNENRPEKAFTTERAKKAGKANAASGQIFVTVAPDYFGPIRAENDPRRNQGVLVGETWEDRMECRQWGAHLPHVAGIAGQADVGAQSVALSGGYQDDEDHGEWFLYTGSGGRDLTGNKRTNKKQSKDQEFSSFNEALRTSCKKGYPVRVVRSHKEKRSSYAPESGVRYDGIYRIEKCWRKVGIQGYKVCRYLFIRCDNEPAPWTSDEYGDRPRPLPAIKELKDAIDITDRKDSPAWDYDEEEGWKWMKTPPISRKPVSTRNPDEKRVRKTMIRAQNKSVQERLLKGFCCLKCRQVMVDPLTTPCAHNFCKSCLMGSYADLSCLRERTRGGRTLRAQKIVKKCPSCPTDISEFLQNPQVNREMMDLIETLKRKIEEENAAEEPSGEGDVEENSSEGGGKLDEDENEGALDIGEGTIAESSSNRKRKKSDKVDVAISNRKRKKSDKVDVAISNRKRKKSDKVDVAILEKIGEEELPIEGDPKPMEEEELPIEGDPMPMEEEELPIEGDPKPLEAEGDQIPVKVANSTLEEELPIEEDPKPMEAEGDQIPVKVANSTLEEELPIERDPKPMEAEGDESLVKVANSTPEEELPIEEDPKPMEAEGVQSPVKVANSPTRVESPSSPLHVPQDVDDFQ